MASKGKIVKAKKNNKNPKFKSRKERRCPVCGRSHGTIRFFDNMCRACIRKAMIDGDLPGFILV